MFSLIQVATSGDKLASLANITESTIYLMGISFILGSLFTILLLLILDFMRLKSDEKK